MQLHPIVKVLVLERDPESARAVATLALEALPHPTETIVGKATTIDGAKRMIEQLAASNSAPLIVICAADLDEEGRALEIVDFARKQHPTTRAIVLTDGEREQFRRALELGVDGLHERVSGLDGLRRLLAYLGSAAPMAPLGNGTAPRSDAMERARADLSAALDSLEEAHAHLARAIVEGSPGATDAERRVREAHRHAVLADRAAMEAEREAGG